jgi:dihydroanticapsin dehydrogenase
VTGRVEGKRVIFTGAVGNIGRAAVEALVREGARVVVGDINAAAGSALQKEFDGRAHFVQCDVTDETSIAGLVEEGVDWLGGLDGLCQNAGVQYAALIADLSTEQWDRTFLVNVRSQFLGAKYAAPHLRAAGGGSIVNTASTAGRRGGPGSTAYAASKGAVITYSATLAVELAPDRIRVNALCPGWVDTAFNQAVIDLMGGREAQRQSVETFVPLKRQGTPADIAPMFVYLISDESAYVTAQAITIDGGLTS